MQPPRRSMLEMNKHVECRIVYFQNSCFTLCNYARQTSELPDQLVGLQRALHCCTKSRRCSALPRIGQRIFRCPMKSDA